MGGFVFTMLLFLAFIILMLIVISSVKGKVRVYCAAVAATLSAWFIGLVLDANIDFGEPAGFLSFRILLPILTMGLCVLRTVMRDRTD